MREPDASVLERVRAGGLVEPDARHVVLVSGGRDSVCLLDVAVALGYVERVDGELQEQLNEVQAMLVALVR